MNTRQRILIPLTHGHSGSALLRHADKIAASRGVDMLVASVLDTRTGFDPDGPAGTLPGERAARLASPEKKRIEHDLMRLGLGWAQATVVWGEPRAALRALVQSWLPDTIVCDGRTRRMLPSGSNRAGPELIMVGGNGALTRLAGIFLPYVQRHA